MMAEHSLMAKEDLSNAGISQDVTYLKQAAHLLRTGQYKIALKYTINALEFNPNSKVIIINQGRLSRAAGESGSVNRVRFLYICMALGYLS